MPLFSAGSLRSSHAYVAEILRGPEDALMRGVADIVLSIIRSGMGPAMYYDMPIPCRRGGCGL